MLLFSEKLAISCILIEKAVEVYTVWKVCKYGVISGPYFPVFNPNTGKYGPEITAYLDTFHAEITVKISYTLLLNFAVK